MSVIKDNPKKPRDLRNQNIVLMKNMKKLNYNTKKTWKPIKKTSLITI